jgi:hypothetical protein
VNCARNGDGLEVRPGFIAGRPKERDFRQAFDREVARMEQFLSERERGSGPPITSRILGNDIVI